MDKWYKKIICLSIDIFANVFKTLFQIPQGCCRFYPSCTEFSKEAVKKLPLFTAAGAIVCRICKCTPLTMGGSDPVIKQKN